MREIKMPQWGMDITEGTVTEWLKKAGDTVEKDEALCEIEEAKASDTLNSPVRGTVAEICVEAGNSAPVFTTICTINESA